MPQTLLCVTAMSTSFSSQTFGSYSPQIILPFTESASRPSQPSHLSLEDAIVEELLSVLTITGTQSGVNQLIPGDYMRVPEVGYTSPTVFYIVAHCTCREAGEDLQCQRHNVDVTL